MILCCARIEFLTTVTVSHTVFWDEMLSAYLSDLLVEPEDAGSMFLQNVSKLLSEYQQHNIPEGSTFNDVLFSCGCHRSQVW